MLNNINIEDSNKGGWGQPLGCRNTLIFESRQICSVVPAGSKQQSQTIDMAVVASFLMSIYSLFIPEPWNLFAVGSDIVVVVIVEVYNRAAVFFFQRFRYFNMGWRESQKGSRSFCPSPYCPTYRPSLWFHLSYFSGTYTSLILFSEWREPFSRITIKSKAFLAVRKFLFLAASIQLPGIGGVYCGDYLRLQSPDVSQFWERKGYRN